MNTFVNVIILMLMLLNPFLLVVYLTDIMRNKSDRYFARLMFSSGLISITVFSLFAAVGDYIFRTVLQAEMASFQIFGGIIFLIIALKFVFNSESAMDSLRADSKHLSTNIAMPIMVGPGTIGVSIMAGERLELKMAILAVVVSVTISITIIVLLKKLFDVIARKRESLIEQYIAVSGKVTALILGTYSIDMIMAGLKIWLNK